MLDEGASSPRLSASTSSETIWLVPSLTTGLFVVLCALIGIGELEGGGAESNMSKGRSITCSVSVLKCFRI